MNETDYVLAYVDYLSHLNGKCTEPAFLYMTCICTLFRGWKNVHFFSMTI